MTRPYYRDAREALQKRVRSVGECLVWTGAKNADGYANITVKGKHRSAHRVAYELAYGPIAAGYQVDHTCHRRACVAVPHLRLVTTQQNQWNQSGQSIRSTTGVRNVYARGEKFIVQITLNGESTYHGTYASLEEAAAVSEKKRAELFGSYAGKGKQ